MLASPVGYELSGFFTFFVCDTGDGVTPGARWYRGWSDTGRGVVSGVGRHRGRSGIEGGVTPGARWIRQGADAAADLRPLGRNGGDRHEALGWTACQGRRLVAREAGSV